MAERNTNKNAKKESVEKKHDEKHKIEIVRLELEASGHAVMVLVAQHQLPICRTLQYSQIMRNS